MSRGIIIAYVEVRMPGKDLSERPKEERMTSYVANMVFFFWKMRVFGLYGSRAEQRSAKMVRGNKERKTVEIEMIAGGEDREMKISWGTSGTGRG